MTVINDFKTCFIVILIMVCIFPLSFIFIEEMQQHFFEAKKNRWKWLLHLVWPQTTIFVFALEWTQGILLPIKKVKIVELYFLLGETFENYTRNLSNYIFFTFNSLHGIFAPDFLKICLTNSLMCLYPLF